MHHYYYYRGCPHTTLACKKCLLKSGTSTKHYYYYAKSILKSPNTHLFYLFYCRPFVMYLSFAYHLNVVVAVILFCHLSKSDT